MNENIVGKPIPKLKFWFLIFVIVASGVVLILMGLYLPHGVPILIGIITVFAAFPLPSWYQKRCRDYEDYLREQEDYLRQQLQERENYYREQARLYEGIRRIVNTANQRIQEMRENLRTATQALDEAENHFNRTAYNPFWDEIEKASSALGCFSENLAEQSSSLEDYLWKVRHYHGVAPNFPGTIRALPRLHRDGRLLANRMSKLVYKAQRNFEFSNIYEHRQTRRILVAGFRNLAGILRGVGNQISNHIEELNATVEVYNEEMAALMENALAQHQERHNETWIQHELHQIETMHANLQQIELGEATLETLDDIYNYLAEDTEDTDM